jgi:UDP-N-acetylglucosamine transferase subunit ALG13
VIFVSVGTQLPFDRMIKTIDEWAGQDSNLEVFGQISDGEYSPKNFKFERYIPAEKFSELYMMADIIISHAGMGNIITALEYSKPIIIFPRRVELGEHRNNHQVSTVEKFQHKENVFLAETKDDLDYAINEIRSRVFEFGRLPSGTNELCEYLDETVKGWFL